MHTAAKDGNKFTIEVLDDLGADINIKDKDGVGYTLLWVSYFFDQMPQLLFCFTVCFSAATIRGQCSFM